MTRKEICYYCGRDHRGGRIQDVEKYLEKLGDYPARFFCCMECRHTAGMKHSFACDVEWGSKTNDEPLQSAH